ncbi:thioredoxin [Candidatus Woesearchaeota archaeon]|nr:thioredoxin [Candidatus Woesearchaeota archaeon]
MVEQVTSADFEQKVLKNKLPVIVDFSAEWCSPCRMLGPIFEKVSEFFKGKVVFLKLNVDKNSDVAQKYNVMGIPCMILFNNGKEVDRFVGAMSEDVLKQKIKALL